MRVILSPHIDDVALSMGGSLLEWCVRGDPCVVINVFTTTAFATGERTPGCGTDPSRLREEEEARIANDFGFRVINLGYPDAGLRGYRVMPSFLNQFVRVRWEHDHNLIAEIEASLATTVRQFGHPVLFLPIAPGGHPDHLIVHAIGKELSRTLLPSELMFYEDLPYCCRYTFKRNRIVRRLHLHKRDVEIDLSAKRELLARYRSSVKAKWITEIDRYARRIGADAPCERFWIPSVVPSGSHETEGPVIRT